MDWSRVIEMNREALKRVLASLVAMAGLGSREQFAFLPQENPLPQGEASAQKSKLSPVLTLPRHLHRAVAKLLRPAEAAARRLIVVAARGIVVPSPPPPRPRKPKPNPTILRRGVVGTGIIMPRGYKPAPLRPPRQTLSLPLFDPLRKPRRWRPIQRGTPRIIFFIPGFVPAPVRPTPTPYDPVSATRLALRFQALASALDDLPRQALRLARLRASRKAAFTRDNDPKTLRPGRWRFHRDWPLKPGHPPGWRKKSSHEVHEVLKDLHYFAFQALEKPDTS